MTYQEVNALVESFGLPCAYYQFTADTATAPPFVCWFFTASDDLNADNTNYVKIRPLRIELYTDYKDFALESVIEDALTAAGLSYERDEGALDAERMYMVTYDLAVIISEGDQNA